MPGGSGMEAKTLTDPVAKVFVLTYKTCKVVKVTDPNSSQRRVVKEQNTMDIS